MARCERLLRAHPTNAELHVAMGDIYAAQQLWPEAAQWYELAQQLGGTPGLAGRLENARRQAESRRHAAPIIPELPLPPRRSRWLPVAVITVSSLLVVLAAFVLLTGGPKLPRHRAITAPTTPPLPSSAPVYGASGTAIKPRSVSQPQVAPALPRTARAPAYKGAATAQTVTGPTVARAPVVITQKVSTPATDRDLYLMETVGSLSWPDGRPMSRSVSAVVDPFTGYAVITFALPPALTADNIKATVALQAYKAAVVAFRSDAGINSLTIRCLATLAGERGAHTTVVAFRANTTRATIEYWNKLHGEPGMDVIWNEVFGEVWWNPGVTADKLQ